jgi:hypothetical protein
LHEFLSFALQPEAQKQTSDEKTKEEEALAQLQRICHVARNLAYLVRESQGTIYWGQDIQDPVDELLKDPQGRNAFPDVVELSRTATGAIKREIIYKSDAGPGDAPTPEYSA